MLYHSLLPPRCWSERHCSMWHLTSSLCPSWCSVSPSSLRDASPTWAAPSPPSWTGLGQRWQRSKPPVTACVSLAVLCCYCCCCHCLLILVKETEHEIGKLNKWKLAKGYSFHKLRSSSREVNKCGSSSPLLTLLEPLFSHFKCFHFYSYYHCCHLLLISLLLIVRVSYKNLASETVWVLIQTDGREINHGSKGCCSCKPLLCYCIVSLTAHVGDVI